MSSLKPDPEGLATYERVFGKPYRSSLDGVRENTINHLFAHVWNRPSLSLRDRRLVTIAVLAALGHPDQLKSHLRGALQGDLSREEILEVMVQVAHYAGWASGMRGQQAAESVLQEMKDD